MGDDQRRHLERMREIYRKRLFVLTQQNAQLGLFVPPHIPIEIEEIQEKIRQIDRALGVTAAIHDAPAMDEPMRLSVKREQVFISYSHDDEKWLRRLQTHLAPLVQANIVKVWDDTKIAPGSKWREEIQHAIEATKVAVLLVSAKFLASNFITDNELPPLLLAAEREGAVILPVIISPSLFEDTKTLSEFQSVNLPSQPLSMLPKPKQEEMLVKVARSIKDALQR